MIAAKSMTAFPASVVFLAGTASAQEDHGENVGPSTKDTSLDSGKVSGNVRLATDCVFRGFTNTDGGPRIQADLTWAFANGFYLGVWSSNTDFGGQGSTMEIDPFVGYAGQIGDSPFSYDVGYWAYFYPNAELDLDGDGQTENADIDYGEVYVYLTFTHGGFSLSPNIWYADDYSGDDFLPDTPAVSYELYGAYAVPGGWLNGWLDGLSISGIYGEQTFDETRGVPDLDYTFYDLGLSYVIGRFTLDVRWHDSDDVSPLFLPSDLVGPRWVAAVTRSFQLSAKAKAPTGGQRGETRYERRRTGTWTRKPGYA